MLATNALSFAYRVNTNSAASGNVTINDSAVPLQQPEFGNAYQVPLANGSQLVCTLEPTGKKEKGRPCRRHCTRWCTWSRGVWNGDGECIRPGVRCAYKLPGTDQVVPGRWNGYGDCHPSTRTGIPIVPVQVPGAPTVPPLPTPPPAIPVTPVPVPAPVAPAVSAAPVAAPAVPAASPAPAR